MAKQDNPPKIHQETSAEALEALEKLKAEKDSRKIAVQIKLKEKAEQKGITEEDLNESVALPEEPKIGDKKTNPVDPEEPVVEPTRKSTENKEDSETQEQKELGLLIENQKKLQQSFNELLKLRNSLAQELAEAEAREAQESSLRNIRPKPEANTEKENKEPEGELENPENTIPLTPQEEYTQLQQTKESIPAWKFWKIGQVYSIWKRQRELQRQKTVVDYSRPSAAEFELKLTATDRTPEERINILSDYIEELNDDRSDLSFIRFATKSKLKGKIEAAQRDKRAMEEIAADRKEKPIWYYAAEKITDPNVLPLVKNIAGTAYNLRWADVKKDDGNSKTKSFIWTGENEGFYEFNILGFTQVLTNAYDVRGIGGRPAANDPKARYKIVDPNGRILAENETYDEANNTFLYAVAAYKEKMQQEFDSLNTQ
jgi:hypothetical protein